MILTERISRGLKMPSLPLSSKLYHAQRRIQNLLRTNRCTPTNNPRKKQAEEEQGQEETQRATTQPQAKTRKSPARQPEEGTRQPEDDPEDPRPRTLVVRKTLVV